MLKSKKALFIAFPVALIIWGFIGYKIYNALHSDDIQDNSVSDFIPTATLHKASDTFALFNNYRDPFLSGIHRTINISTQTKLNATVNPVKRSNPGKTVTPVNNDWPSILYSGILKNQSNSVSLLLLSINGKTHTVRQGDDAEGIKVLSFTNTEVTLLRGKEKKIFAR